MNWTQKLLVGQWIAGALAVLLLLMAAAGKAAPFFGVLSFLFLLTLVAASAVKAMVYRWHRAGSVDKGTASDTSRDRLGSLIQDGAGASSAR